MTYLIAIVQVHDTTPLRVDRLVALSLPTHDQSRVHVHVMTGQIQRNQALENHAVCRFGGRQEDEQTSGRTSIGDHVEHCTEPRALLEFACRDSIQSIQETRDGV